MDFAGLPLMPKPKTGTATAKAIYRHLSLHQLRKIGVGPWTEPKKRAARGQRAVSWGIAMKISEDHEAAEVGHWDLNTSNFGTFMVFGASPDVWMISTVAIHQNPEDTPLVKVHGSKPSSEILGDILGI